MLHERDIARLGEISDRYQAADAIGFVLYGRRSDRFDEFRRAFLAGVEDAEGGIWIEARGSGPYATGYNLGSVWVSRS